MIDKLIDIVLFRYTGQKHDNNENPQPFMTTGSIVATGLFGIAFVIFASWFLSDVMNWNDSVAILLSLSLVILVVWRRYTLYNERIEDLKESTLCGSCRNFDPTSQLCRIFDEHVSTTYIPCEGESWEPRSVEETD